MFKNAITSVGIFISFSFLAACGEGDAPETNSGQLSVEATTSNKEMTTQLSTVVSGKSELETKNDVVFLPNQVVYQEEIYKNWPYTEAPSTTQAKLTEPIDESLSENVASDKPYQVVDGKISQNAVEGWKTFNGGGCGTCHGKGAIGGVGPNLGESVTTKLTKDQFIETVTNGRAGTMMRPMKTNKRVMDNLDNLYAYLVARGDNVLGPGNLIKMPLGK